jgi:hypothetical protein
MKQNPWIRIASAAALLACLLSCVVCMPLSASAEAEFLMAIPYGKPTVDGVIEEGEYGASYIMNKESAEAWVGEVGSSSVTWYVAWDEGGLYYAGTINDRTPSWRDENGHWVGIDCLELAVNPGMLLSGDRAEGVFFSCGSMKDGSVVVYRHNYADGLVSDQIIGANTGHVKGSKSYTMEIYLPWSLVQIDEDCTVGGKKDIHLDSTGWEPKSGATLGLLPCAIDSLDAQGKNIIAYKFNGTDFVVSDFVEAVLIPPEWETSDAETSAETPEDTAEQPADSTPDQTSPSVSDPVDTPAEETTAPAADGTGALTDTPADSTDTPDKKGCGAAMTAGLLTLLMPAAWVALRKRRD